MGLVGFSRDNNVTNVASLDNVSIPWGLQPPDAPTGLNVAVTPAQSQATLSWNATGGAAGYTVKQATVSGGPYTTIASGTNATSFVATGLGSGTNYYFVVSGTNLVGQGTNSVEVMADLTPPVISVPSNIVATSADSNVAVSFTTSALDAVSGSCATTNSPASGSAFPLGVSTVTVTAVDATGNSATRTFTVTVNLPTPTGFAAAALSDSQIKLTWTNNAPNAAAYMVQRSIHGINSWTTLISALSPGAGTYTDATASASTAYDYRIRCIGGAGTSEYATLAASTPAGIGDGIAGSWRYQYFGNGLTVTPVFIERSSNRGD